LFKNDGGELTPEWVLNQQHKGGEYRKWRHIEKENGRPVIYIAEGAHTSYFGADQSSDELDNTARDIEDGGVSSLTGKQSPLYIYQDQYFQSDSPGTTDLFEFKGVKDITGYVDTIDYGSKGSVWKPETDYEISILTGEESWSDYTGDYLTYPIGKVGENQGATAGDIPQRTTQFSDTRSWVQSTLFPDVAQIDAEFTDEDDDLQIGIGGGKDVGEIQDDVIVPDGRGIDELECAELFAPISCTKFEAPPAIVTEGDVINPDEADGSVGVNVINSGMQPHDFTLDLDAYEKIGGESIQSSDISEPGGPALPSGGDLDNQAGYSFYVNSIYPKNVAGAEVDLTPLGINEPGEYTVDAGLWVYPDDYQLDTEEFELNITEELPEPTLEIDEGETIDAGTINESRIVEVDVSVEGRDQLSGEYEWSVTVGGEEASFYDDGSLLTVYEGDGEYRVVFYAPEKDESGTYDVEVELETDDEELSDEKEDLLAYSEPGEVAQTATALVLDKSGSMGTRDAGGTRMSAAKAAALGVIDRQSDSDYVSVVGFSSGSSVRQGLAQLGDGRSSAESAVAGLGPGGFTNIGAGLRDGIEEVTEAPDGAQKNIILMSDGGRNRGPSESAIRGMVRNRMNPNGICLQTNSLGSGADEAFMNSLSDAADCSESTESDSRDEIVQDFINLTREFDASELIDEIEGRVGGGDTFEGTFGIGDDTTSAILDVATGTGVSGLEVRSESNEGKIDVDDNLSDAELNTSGTSIESIRTGTLDSPAPEDRDVRLYRPNGSIVYPESDPDVEVSSTGDRTVYRINDPEAGEWSYEIDGGDGGTGFEVVITADSLAKMDVDSSSDEYYTGTSAALTTTLFGTEPVTDANVEAEVEAPDGSSKTVTLEEVSVGVYRTTVDLEEGVSGTYEATVKATKENENIERRATVNWEAEFAAPVSISQSRVPEVESGSEGEIGVSIESEAVLGIRSVDLGVSDFTHEASDAKISGSRVSMDGSYLIQSGETVPVDATVNVPGDTPTGVYTAEASALVDGSGTTVDEVALRVGGGADCVNRRDAGRGETDELCSDDRDLSRGDERGYERRDRGRGDRGGGAGRRDRGR